MDNSESDYAPMLRSGGFLKAAVKQEVAKAEGKAKGRMRRAIIMAKAANGLSHAAADGVVERA